MAESTIDILRRQYLGDPLRAKFPELCCTTEFPDVCYVEDLQIYIPCKHLRSDEVIEHNYEMFEIELAVAIDTPYYQNCKFFRSNDGNGYRIRHHWKIQGFTKKKINKAYKKLLLQFEKID